MATVGQTESTNPTVASSILPPVGPPLASSPRLDDSAPTKRRFATWTSRLPLAVTLGLSAALGLFCVDQLLAFGLDLHRWDAMFISGSATFLVGLTLARQIPRRMRATLARLRDRGILQATPERLEHFQRRFEARVNFWAHRIAVVITALLLLATAVADGFRAFPGALPLLLVEVPVGYVSGLFLGRMIVYGFLGNALRWQKIELKVKPGHVDGCAGFRPVGDFYFFQAMLATIPALFLALWWFLIPVWPHVSYARWRDPYLGLLAVALLIEILAFILPMLSFHEEMLVQKAEALRVADSISQKIVELQAELAGLNPDQPSGALKERLTALTQSYWDLENMPTWPVAPDTRRRFTVNNAALFLPLLSQLFGLQGVTAHLVQSLGDILGRLSG